MKNHKYDDLHRIWLKYKIRCYKKKPYKFRNMLIYYETTTIIQVSQQSSQKIGFAYLKALFTNYK